VINTPLRISSLHSVVRNPISSFFQDFNMSPDDWSDNSYGHASHASAEEEPQRFHGGEACVPCIWANFCRAHARTQEKHWGCESLYA
jgi:hypothetical protein